MSLPYFPMYPTDFEAKTSHLTLEEDGAYNRLLRLMWMTPGCSLPDDDAWIMRRMRCDADTYDRVVLIVINEFCDRENGRVSNAKLTRVFNDSAEKHSKRVLAGSAGGKAKALKTNNKPSSNTKAKPYQPEPEPDTTLEDKSSNGASADPARVIFSSGLALLVQSGKTEPQARSILGKWRKGNSDGVVIEALGKAQREGAIDPVAFCEGIFRHTQKTAPKKGFVNAGAFGNIPERN